MGDEQINDEELTLPRWVVHEEAIDELRTLVNDAAGARFDMNRRLRRLEGENLSPEVAKTLADINAHRQALAIELRALEPAIRRISDQAAPLVAVVAGLSRKIGEPQSDRVYEVAENSAFTVVVDRLIELLEIAREGEPVLRDRGASRLQ